MGARDRPAFQAAVHEVGTLHVRLFVGLPRGVNPRVGWIRAGRGVVSSGSERGGGDVPAGAAAAASQGATLRDGLPRASGRLPYEAGVHVDSTWVHVGEFLLGIYVGVTCMWGGGGFLIGSEGLSLMGRSEKG